MLSAARRRLRVEACGPGSQRPERAAWGSASLPETPSGDCGAGCAQGRGRAASLPRDLPGKAWSLPVVRQLRIGLEPDSPTGRPAFPPGTEDASKDDGVMIKASLS